MLPPDLLHYFAQGLHVVVSVPTKSLHDMWGVDKELIRSGLNHLGLSLDGNLPTNDAALAIVAEHQGKWEKPPAPVTLSPDYLEDRLAVLVPLVEKAAGTSFDEAPTIDVLSLTEYLPRINEISKMLDDLVGMPSKEMLSAPGSLFSPYTNTIIVPSTFIVRYSPDFGHNDVHQGVRERAFPWDADHFDYVLVSQLARGLYRQVRGESGEGYVKAMRTLGPIHSKATSFVNSVFEQRVSEKVASDLPSITRAVLCDKMLTVWSSQLHQRAYLAIHTLEDHKPLYAIVCADFIFGKPRASPGVSFQRNHPNHVENLVTYQKSLNPN